METGITKLFNENGEQIITSLDIAKLTGKEHRNVLRDIRNMEPAWEKLHQLKFEQMQIRENLPNNGYRLRTVYALTKLECLYIATKYDDVSRARLVLRWEELEKEEVRTLVEKTLRSHENMIMMLEKHGKNAVYQIDHGQLHLDFDNRENSSWNDDIINMFPLDYPVTMTSWKGIIYVHCLDDETINCSCMGTREIMEIILAAHGDKRKLTKK